jgi:hypothetical protein
VPERVLAISNGEPVAFLNARPTDGSEALPPRFSRLQALELFERRAHYRRRFMGFGVAIIRVL